MKSPSTQDWFGHMIGLQFAIAELASELSVDVILDNPRLVMLAIGGLEAKASELVEAMKRGMEQFSVDTPKENR